MKNFSIVLISFFILSVTYGQKTSSFADYYNSGVKNYEEGNYEEGLVDLSNAIQKDPKSVWAWMYRGLCYQAKMNHANAINDFTKSLELNNKLYYLWQMRASSHQDTDNYDDAISDFSEAIRLAPDTPGVWISRSTAYAQKRVFDKALDDANEAIRLNPLNSSGYVNRGWIYVRMEEYHQAMSDLNQAVRINPSDVLALMNRGDLHYNLGEFDKAIADCNESIRLDTYSEYKGYSYINMITTYCRKLQFDIAKALYNEYNQNKLTSFVEKRARFYTFYLKAATEDIPKRDYQGALTNLNTAVIRYNAELKNVGDNKTEYIAVLVLKGFVLEQLARYDEAIDAYNQALVVNNNQPDIKDALQRLNKETLVKQNTDKTAPLIEILSPQATRGFEIVTAKSEVQIIGRARDASGIKEVKINGIKARTEEDGLFFCAVPLKAGENETTVTASDKQGNLGSNEFILTGKLISSKNEGTDTDITPVVNTEVAQQYFAIIIAARDYTDPGIQDLENPVQDAAELKSILEKNYTFDSKNIKTLYNKNKDDIMQTIIQTGNALTENDNLLIFYAGHGIAEKDKFGDVDGYWIPSSAKKGLTSTYISADDIKKALKRSNAKHILVVADACFSGAFTRGMSSDASVAIQKQYSVPSRKVMASGNLEPVPDNSKFIYFLKKNLKENKEKYLTAKKLFDGFYEAILNNSDTSPQYAAIKNVGDEGGEFVFIKK
jgi:tetratricopeptide (TPR) repeat protein